MAVPRRSRWFPLVHPVSRFPLEAKQNWICERHGQGQDTDGFSAELDFRQRHHTVADVAKMWSLGPGALRRLFEGEPGVLVLGGNGGRVRRSHTTLRIPHSVVERVYRRRLSR